MFIIYQATRSILNISCLLLLGSTELWMGKSRSDGLEILGDQKVAPVARGFRVQVKIFSKKYQKTTDLLIITQLLSRTLSNRSTTVCDQCTKWRQLHVFDLEGFHQINTFAEMKIWWTTVKSFGKVPRGD